MTGLASNNNISDANKGPKAAGAENPQNNPREFMWSATAVSFGALMAVLEAYTDMRQQQMLLSNSVSTEIASATIAEGAAQVAAADAQADGTREQGDASMAQAFGSGVGIVGSGLGAWKAASASFAIKPMNELTDQVNTMQFKPPQMIVQADGSSVPSPVDANVSVLQDKLIQNQYSATNAKTPAMNLLTPDADGNTGLSKQLGTTADGQKITLQNLLETASTKDEFNKMQTAVGTVKDEALKTYQTQQTFANNIISTFQSIGSLVGSAGSSVCASRQATAQEMAGAAQQNTTFAAALQQFSNTTYSNIRQSASYADQGVGGTFSFILNMENNDMRG